MLVAKDCTEGLSTRTVLLYRLYTSKAMLHKKASNHAKLPDSASHGHGKITCGKRLYRRAENEDSTAALPECQQAHAAQSAHEPAAKRAESSCAESEMLQKDTYMQAAEQTENMTHIQMWPVGPDEAEKRKATAQRATRRKQTSRLPQQTVEQAYMSAEGKQDHKRPARDVAGSYGPQKETKTAEGKARKKRVTEQTGTQVIRSFFVFGQSTRTSKATKEREDTQAAHAQQTTIKRHKTQGESAKALPTLKGLCWNVRGLTTVLQELTQLVEEHNPDFVVLTETKLRKGSTYRKRLTEALEDYVVHTSCKRDTPDMREGERTGAAGVAIAIHKKLTAHDSLKVLPLNHPAASGHCQKVSIQPAGSDAVDIWAVYMPHDMVIRREVYQVLETNEMHSKNFIMAGDWNAAYMAADRSTGELQQPADDEHAQMLQGNADETNR